MNAYIQNLINDNKRANKAIISLEHDIVSYTISDEKSKADFGNICTALTGFRLIAKATECLLINANVFKDDDGNYYQKLEEDTVPPSTEGNGGSDLDADQNSK